VIGKLIRDQRVGPKIDSIVITTYAIVITCQAMSSEQREKNDPTKGLFQDTNREYVGSSDR
jgi:hypothetical protein